MEFRVLGPVEIWAGGRALEVGPPLQRSVLAVLATEAGRPVQVEVLVDRVWGESPPARAQRGVHAYVARVRRLLSQADSNGTAPVRLVRRSGGYVLDVEPDRVDLHRFRRLVDRARDPHSLDEERAGLLREALDLWRGEPLAGVPGEWAARVREEWRRQHLDATVLWAQVELQAGNPAGVVGRLTDLIVGYPLVEPLAAVLMRALHAAGRSAEALECYASTRQRLVDELGADPGAELQAVHQAILRGDLDQVRQPTAVRAVPAQLPLDVFGFTGREDEIARLDAILAAARDQPTAMVVSALSGTAGVGKTALAVRWAHRVRQEFPDGQLYVNLRGFDPSGSVMSPAEAVRGFLDALEVSTQRIPASPDAQTALYRSLLAGRRVLVVLDNAQGVEQVRPLLPGTPGCLALVTSRSQLTGLVAVEGAYPLTLDLLSTDEARELLARRLGTDRVAAEPAAVDEIVERSARLPLALAIVAARASCHPGFRLEALAGELREARDGLDAFDGGDVASDARAVFSWSYRTLSAPAARLFRLLGLHPGPDIGTAAAASLAGLPAPLVRQPLAELGRAHLVTEHTPGRFAFHDLLRTYATELAHAFDPPEDRHAAVHRALDHYLHTAHAAALLMDPYRYGITVAPALPGVTPQPLADTAQALAWFAAEHLVLLAAVDHAADHGFDVHAWQLAWAIAGFFNRRGHWHDQATTLSTALDAARRLADRPGQSRTHRSLAVAWMRLGRYDAAHTHFRCALDLCRELDDKIGQARAHLGICGVLERESRHASALRHSQQALDLYQAAEDEAGQADALNMVGWYHSLLGDHEQAHTYCQQALALHQKVGNRVGEADTCDSLGYAHHHLGDHQHAISCYQQALGLYREAGSRYYEAAVLRHLGDTYQDAGEPRAARDAWQQARIILDELDHPDADQIRAMLRKLA
jgi:DNA-binding SARP family transcriptional activator/tetratricopeptide (TPR) repeat protein